MMILGIDPGMKGALAVYNTDTSCIDFACNVPTLTVEKGGKDKNQVNIHELVRTGRRLVADYDLMGLIEQVGSNMVHGRKQSGRSMFSFGRVDGILETLLVSLEIPYGKVPPQTWKKALGCLADKDQSLLRASQLMPRSVGFWTPQRGMRDKADCQGIAEAALIAYYGAAKVFC